MDFLEVLPPFNAFYLLSPDDGAHAHGQPIVRVVKQFCGINKTARELNRNEIIARRRRYK